MKVRPVSRLAYTKIICIVMFVSLLVASGCGTSATLESAVKQQTNALTEVATVQETTAVPEATKTTRTVTVPEIIVEKEAVSTARTQEKALRGCTQEGDAPTRDDLSYADDHGVSGEKAVRRMRLQECLSTDLHELKRRLMRNEGDNFAGFWVENEPQYRFVFLFTKNGLQKIRPYIRGETYAPLLEVRSGAEASLAELNAAHTKASRIVDSLDMPADSATDIKKNRVEVFVTDRNEFESELRKAGLRLPAHVALIQVEGLARPD